MFHKRYIGICAAFDISVEEAEATYQPRLEQLQVAVKVLEGKLLRLQLSNTWAEWEGDRYQVWTTFLNALSFKKPTRSEGEKTNERSELLARSIYGQWLVQALHGMRVYTNSRGKRRDSNDG